MKFENDSDKKTVQESFITIASQFSFIVFKWICVDVISLAVYLSLCASVRTYNIGVCIFDSGYNMIFIQYMKAHK